MARHHLLHRLTLIAAIALFGLLITGCGGDEESKTGAGATSGATGEAAGGFAVEAGKQRDPEDVKRESEFTNEPPPVQVLTGNETGYRVDEPTLVVVQSNKDLKALEKKHFSNGVSRQDVLPVEFDSRQVIALFMPDMAPGSQVAITDVSTRDGEMKVKAVVVKPGKGCKYGKERPRPIHWVETRKLDGEAKLELDEIESSPC